MTVERRQFRVLYRTFLKNTIDFDLVATGGDAQNLIGQLAAILIAFNFVVSLVILPRYFTSALDQSVLRTNARADEEFLISTTISIVALLMVLGWDALIPDQKDALILEVLPVRMRTVFLSKLAALGTLVGGAVVLLNLFTSAGFATVAAPTNQVSTVLRCFAAYWIAMIAGSAFVGCSILVFQGVLLQLLSYRRFLSISSYVQLSAVFLLVSVYVLKPAIATPSGLTAAANKVWLQYSPSYWFLGIFQELNGSTDPVFGWLARRGARAAIVAVTCALGIYGLAYGRNFRRMLEQPEIVPGGKPFRVLDRFLDDISTTLRWSQLDRAIISFTARTLARSRKHRLIMALYSGIGLGVALIFAVNLLPDEAIAKWTDPNPALCVGSLVLLFFTILGARVVFALPFALRSNWIFRTTAIATSTAYFQSVRKALYVVVAVPAWGGLAVFFLAFWPVDIAFRHLSVLAVLLITFVERLLLGFRKIPFTCSYLPGKANLKVTLGTYGAVILFFAYVGGEIEYLLLHRATGYRVMFALLLGSAAWVFRKRKVFSTSSQVPIQFEDLPPSHIELLDLEREGDVLGAQ